MFVVPASGSMRRSSLKSTGLRFASSLAARFLALSISARCDDGMPRQLARAVRRVAHDRGGIVRENAGQHREVSDDIAHVVRELADRLDIAGHGVEVAHGAKLLTRRGAGKPPLTFARAAPISLLCLAESMEGSW
jgi:hypothetical protein